MSIDISQFYQVFFEESLEGLDAMETALMELSPDDIDFETINTIFRAAHSIKGGSATFGFSAVADFTHVLETLLDEIREGSRGITVEHIDLFLQSVDCLRSMINTLQAGDVIDPADSADLKSQFEAILVGSPGAVASSVVTESKSNPAPFAAGGWRIHFQPEADMLRTGNEPIRMFRELASLGELTVSANLSNLPKLAGLNPELSYLSWDLELRGSAALDDIKEVFEWVEDEADISYHAIEEDNAVAAMIENSLDVAAEESVVAPPPTNVDELIAADMALVPDNSIEPEPVQAPQAKVPAANQLPAKEPAAKAMAKAPTESSIRVGIDKIDQLINLVGELVITQSMLGQLGEGDSAEFTQEKLMRLQEGLGQLEQNTRELQESVMRIRMLPISFTFSRFPRMVRDLSKRLNKDINLVLQGEQTELDKTVMEKVGDPLVHLVRNSVDHGIESPEKRIAAGKPSQGKVILNAYHQGGNVVIEIKDDGAGLNKERILQKAIDNGLVAPGESLSDDQINDLIFQPGFSTATEVSDVSGRGVGMDVVRRNIQELNGTVDVRSETGVGSTFTIRLPLTLAILDGQLVRVGDQNYIFPLVSIVESLQIDMAMVNAVAGGGQVLRLRDEYIQIVCLHEIYGIKADFTSIDEGLVVVVELEGSKYGIVVDDLLAQQQVVIKSLETNYRRVEGVSGATILGDGTVALIIDISGIIKMGGVQQARTQAGAMAQGRSTTRVA